MATMIVCKRVEYAGRVQGVGFRYTAQALAAGYAVAGTVRNLDNGEVELVAEGEPEQVTAYLGAVAQHMGRYIERTTVHDCTPSGQQGFRILR
jgi:acylphosphatase